MSVSVCCYAMHRRVGMAQCVDVHLNRAGVVCHEGGLSGGCEEYEGAYAHGYVM